jgi:hypothetical protein
MRYVFSIFNDRKVKLKKGLGTHFAFENWSLNLSFGGGWDIFTPRYFYESALKILDC